MNKANDQDKPARSPKDQPVTPWGAFVMFWLLIAAIVAASIPMAIGMGVTVLIPWLGHLKTSFTPWMLLHFLWIYPVLWAVGLVVDPILKHLFATGPARKVGEVLDDIIGILLLALMYYSIFFQDALGAVVAALISGILMKFVVERLENHTPPDEPDSEDPQPDAATTE